MPAASIAPDGHNGRSPAPSGARYHKPQLPRCMAKAARRTSPPRHAEAGDATQRLPIDQLREPETRSSSKSKPIVLISLMDGSLVWKNQHHQSGTLMPLGAVHPIIATNDQPFSHLFSAEAVTGAASLAVWHR